METKYFELGQTGKEKVSNKIILNVYVAFIIIKLVDRFNKPSESQTQFITEIIIYAIFGVIVVMKNRGYGIFKNKNFIKVCDDAIEFKTGYFKKAIKLNWKQMSSVEYNDYKYVFYLLNEQKVSLNLGWEAMKTANHINLAVKNQLIEKNIQIMR